MIYDLHYSNPEIVIWYEEKKGHGMYQSAFQELLMTVWIMWCHLNLGNRKFIIIIDKITISFNHDKIFLCW